MCIDRDPTWSTEINHTGLCQLLETCFSKRTTKGEILVRQDDLLVLDCSSIDFLGLQFTTCDYIKDTKGHYMPKENFLYLRISERMIAKTTFPTPIHLLDHIIIPIHIRKGLGILSTEGVDASGSALGGRRGFVSRYRTVNVILK